MSVENQWFVRLPAGNVITVSLDDLDAAFQRGDVDESTLVFRQGMKAWLPLGEAAGLDDEGTADDTRQEAPQHADSVAPLAVSQPQVSQQVVRPAASDPYSVRPVAMDAYSATPLSFETADSFEPQFKSGKKKKVVIGLIAAAAVLGLGIFAASSMSGAAATATASITPVATMVAAAAAPPPVSELPQTDPGNRLSDEVKKQLAAADTKLKAASDKKAQDRAAKAATKSTNVRRGKTKDPFVKGGNKYDPLNASL